MHAARQVLRVALPCLLLAARAGVAGSQTPNESQPEPEPSERQRDLGELSLEELMDLEVITVSRKEERWFDASAAVFVILPEHIRRSGATSIPEVLRQVPGVQVARVNSSQWAITARGFNNQFANKLLVLIDGRSVYTPLFAGVYWDVQDVPLDNVERIEVIRGPGATLWGANAVNGVINIITKNAADTPGWRVAAGAGTEERAIASLRYGGRAASTLHYRLDARGFMRDAFVDDAGAAGADDWHVERGGFRLDWVAGARDVVAVHGGIYGGRLGQRVTLSTPTPPFVTEVEQDASVSGRHVVARWDHAHSPRARTAAQAYFDRTWRADPFLAEVRNTFDLDLQHDFELGEQRLAAGFGYRFTNDDIDSTFVARLDPSSRSDHLFSAFVQAEVPFAAKRGRFTLGSKFEHNSYTGFEIQPTARIAWSPRPTHTLWTSVSRAVRTPSRVEDDVRFIVLVLGTPTPQHLTLTGNRDLRSDELLALEVGYRLQPTPSFLADVAAFVNLYDNLGTIEPGPARLEPQPPPEHTVVPLVYDNLGFGRTHGVEISSLWRIAPALEISAAYTWFGIDIEREPESRDLGATTAEQFDPENQLHLRAHVDLPGRVDADVAYSFVDELPAVRVSECQRLDVRIGWQPVSAWSFDAIGHNLLDPDHLEFGDSVTSGQATRVQRGVYGRVVWRP